MNIPGPPLFGEGFQEPINSKNYGTSAGNSAGRVSAASDHDTVAVPRNTNNLTQHSSKEWEDQKDTLIELFICRKMTLSDVVSIMEARGFYASEKQYRDRFAAWHVRKKLRPDEKRIIARIWLWRKQMCGQETAFLAWSRLVPQHQLETIVEDYGKPLEPDDPTLTPPPFWLFYCTPPWTNPSDGESAGPSTSSDFTELLPSTSTNIVTAAAADRELFQLASPDAVNLPTLLCPNPEGVSLGMNTMHQLLPTKPAETITYPLCSQCGSCAGPTGVPLVNAASNQHQQTAEGILWFPNNEAGEQAVIIYPNKFSQHCGQNLYSFSNAFVAGGGFDRLSGQVNATSQNELSGVHEESFRNL